MGTFVVGLVVASSDQLVPLQVDQPQGLVTLQQLGYMRKCFRSKIITLQLQPLQEDILSQVLCHLTSFHISQVLAAHVQALQRGVLLHIGHENFDLRRSEVHAGDGELMVGGIGIEIVDHMPEFALMINCIPLSVFDSAASSCKRLFSSAIFSRAILFSCSFSFIIDSFFLSFSSLSLCNFSSRLRRSSSFCIFWRFFSSTRVVLGSMTLYIFCGRVCSFKSILKLIIKRFPRLLVGQLQFPELSHLFVYKFMIKTQSCKTVQRSLPKIKPAKGETSTHRYEKEHDGSVAAINSTFDCNAYMNRLHKWKKQVRTKKLQVIYDENIRLFVSLAKQKSSYHFPNLKKVELKRGLGRRLIPLTERSMAQRNQ